MTISSARIEVHTTTEDNLSLLTELMAGRARPGGDLRGGARRDRIVDYITGAVRHAEPTPVVRLTVDVGGLARTVFLKLDGRSRWGSVKGRTALGLLGSVAHRVDDDTVIVESTSGNLGVALAGICRDLDIAFTAVVDDRLPLGMRARLAACGARLVQVAHADDALHLQRRLARVREILREDANAVWTNQYENPANVAVHRLWTGPELGRQLGPELQMVFVPVSTGGSFVGLRDYLAVARPEVACTAVDVCGSTIFGGVPGRRVLTGIGASKPSVFLGEHDWPPHVLVSDGEAIATCRALARDVGIGVGGSSGATLAGCLRVLGERPDLTVALCLCPDLASNYTETLYDDDWLRRAGVTDAVRWPAVDGRPVRFTSVRR